MIRPALAALAVLLLPASAPAQISGFQMPSGKIFCAYTSFEGVRNLRCDITRPTNRQPANPASCDFDYGPYFGLTPTGKGRRLCVSDTPMDPSFPKLAYGKTFKRGPFTCRSRTANVRCTNTAGHGFELSRSKQKLF